jgi:hypothetical protein
MIYFRYFFVYESNGKNMADLSSHARKKHKKGTLYDGDAKSRHEDFRPRRVISALKFPPEESADYLTAGG